MTPTCMLYPMLPSAIMEELFARLLHFGIPLGRQNSPTEQSHALAVKDRNLFASQRSAFQRSVGRSTSERSRSRGLAVPQRYPRWKGWLRCTEHWRPLKNMFFSLACGCLGACGSYPVCVPDMGRHGHPRHG